MAYSRSINGEEAMQAQNTIDPRLLHLGGYLGHLDTAPAPLQVEGYAFAQAGTGNDVTSFIAKDKHIRENRLPFFMASIEFYQPSTQSNDQRSNGYQLTERPTVVLPNGMLKTSPVTGRQIRDLSDILPEQVSSKLEAWRAALWMREAASKGVNLRWQDLLDRMTTPLSLSTLSNRVQRWQVSVGMLPLESKHNYGFPSYQSVATLSNLTEEQVRFNTWWDVHHDAANDVYVARQPTTHAGYHTTYEPGYDDNPPPCFVINDDHHNRHISYILQEILDAMLYLQLKAQECGNGGAEEMLQWLSMSCTSQAESEARAEFVVDFQRWRTGCSDTPDVRDFRSAIDQAPSEDAIRLILNADYSGDPQLLAASTRLQLQAAGRWQAVNWSLRADMMGRVFASKKRKGLSNDFPDGMRPKATA